MYVLSDSHYRLTGLLPLFLLGAVLGRVGHTTARTQRATAALGLLAGCGWLVGKALHWSTDPGRWVDNTLDVALSALVVAAVCAAAGAPALLGVVSRAVLRPVAVIGTVALSTNALQFVLLVLLVRHGPAWLPFGWRPAAVFVAACLLVSWWWARLVGTGPLECAFGALSGRALLQRQPARG